ncbi:MAG: glycosyltransferase family 2 protein [Lachnospiraceae bacterium]|nr:glycosyltransferase family 2 protein [Lachnospiraceae bacterium]
MEMNSDMKKQLSIVMPCRNEAATVGICVDEAARMMAEHDLNGEIIVIDNASSDSSAKEAESHGAKVIREDRTGYGYAIRRGLSEASGDVIIIGDCDTTYDFAESYRIYEMLAGGGYDMVVPDRFAGKMEKGAMQLSHVLGVKFLSYIGRKKFDTDVRDFHCGLRGITRDALKKIELHTGGMEFASEMIAEAAASGLRIGQIGITLRRCGYPRRSKLNAARDGMRHLLYILRFTARR